jgi:hypothetical protein
MQTQVRCVLAARSGMRVGQPIQLPGFCLAGLLCVGLAVLKLKAEGHWSLVASSTSVMGDLGAQHPLYTGWLNRALVRRSRRRRRRPHHPPEPSANIFHDPAVCGGRITGTREQLTCDKCGQRFTLDQVQQQFDSSALSEALKALHRFEIDSA